MDDVSTHLARQIAAHLEQLTGRRVPRPRTVSGLQGSILRIPSPEGSDLRTLLNALNSHVRRARRAEEKGRDESVYAHLSDALGVLERAGGVAQPDPAPARG